MAQKTIQYEDPSGSTHTLRVDIPDGMSPEDITHDLDTQWMTRQKPSAGQPPQGIVKSTQESAGDHLSKILTPGSYAESKLNSFGAGPHQLSPEDALNSSLFAGGEALDAIPALNSANRVKNAILGAGKGVGISELATRLGNFFQGKEQPSIAQNLPNDAIGGALGGVGGFFRAPQPPGKPSSEDIFNSGKQKYEAWKAENDQAHGALSQATRDYNIANKQKTRLAEQRNAQDTLLNDASKEAKTADDQMYHAAQAKYRTAIKQHQEDLESSGQRIINLQDELDKVNKTDVLAKKKTSGLDLNTLDDELLKESKKLDELRANKFEPDSDRVAELKDNIKKYKAQAEQHSGAVKQQAQRRLQEHSRALETELGTAADADEANQEEILNSMRRIRELKTAKGQISGGRAHLPGQADDMGFTQPAPDAQNNRVADLQNELEHAKSLYQQKKLNIKNLQSSQAAHAESAPGNNGYSAVNMPSETRRLNDLNDRVTQAREESYNLYRQKEEARHAATLHDMDNPGLPKAPSRGDKVMDMAKLLGIPAAKGGVVGGATALGAHLLGGLPWGMAGELGGAASAAGSALLGTPQGQAVLKQAPRAIPAIPVISEKAKKQLKELLGI